MNLYLKLEAPYEWARVNGQKVEAFGEVPSIAEFPVLEDDNLIGVVPGEWVTTQVVNLPARTRKQFETALPYALEESIAQDVEELHFVCNNWSPSTDCVVHVIAREKMLEWQNLANQHRLPIQQLIPDHALLPFHEASDSSLALVEDHIGDRLMAKQRSGQSHSLDQNLIDLWLLEIPVDSVVAVNDEELTKKLIEEYPSRDFRHWSFGSKIAHWLEYSPGANVNLWGDKYRPRMRGLNTKVLLIPMLIFCASIVVQLA